MRQTLGFKEAFSRLDSGIGFLTFKDLQLGLPQQFGITLKREEILRLFKEIDQDRDGIIKLNEFENYYNKDYNKQFKNIEKEKEHVNMQYDIFEHLIKVLK
jgi:Ca2+-binding EF-hand superfamily protein